MILALAPVVGRDRPGAVADLGMLEIRAHQIAGDLALKPNDLVGYVTVLLPACDADGRPVLIVDVTHSAVLEDIVDPYDIDGAGRNLFTELVRSVVAAYQSQLVDVMLSRWGRAARAHHWASLEHTTRRRAHTIATWVDGRRLSWDNASGLVGNSVQATQGQAGGHHLKTTSFVGCAARCRALLECDVVRCSGRTAGPGRRTAAEAGMVRMAARTCPARTVSLMSDSCAVALAAVGSIPHVRVRGGS